MTEEHLLSIPSTWQGAWESVDGNPAPDIYIMLGQGGRYYLLAYSYDKEYGRGSFTCYDVESDESGYYICVGTKCCRVESGQSPYGLSVAGWGSYMKY